MLSLSFSKLTTVEDQNALFLSFERVVVQKFLDQIHVTHEHASTAVSLQLQRVQRVLLGVIRLQQIEVRVPLVSNHLFDERRKREREREIASDHSRKDHATGRTRPRRRVCEERRRSIDRFGLFFAIIAKKRRKVSRIDRSIHHIAIFAALSLDFVRSIESPHPPERTKKT